MCVCIYTHTYTLSPLLYFSHLIYIIYYYHSGGGLVAQLYLTLCNPMGKAPLPMGFSRQECWSGWSLLSPVELPDPRIKPRSPVLQAISFIAGRFFTE